MLNNFTTVKKVAWGFALLTLVLMVAVALTLWQVARTQRVTQELVGKSGPMTEASLRLISGVNNSISQLRSWMILKDERYKRERLEAWSEWIEPSLANLKRLIDESGDTTQQEQLDTVEQQLQQLKQYQEQIEDIAPSVSSPTPQTAVQ